MQHSGVIDLRLRTTHLHTAVRLEVSTTAHNGAAGRNVSGSGFLVNDPEIAGPVLVTNRHVVEPSWAAPRTSSPIAGITAQELRVHAADFATGQAVPTVVTLDREALRGSVYAENWDVAAVRCPAESSTDLMKIGREELAEREEFDGVSISAFDFLAVAGYPQIGASASVNPMALPGLLSSDPSHEDVHPEVPPGAIVYQAFSRSGLSGGPVIAPTRGLKTQGDVLMETDGFRPARVIGVNGGHLRAHDQQLVGLSYFYPSWVVLRLLDLVRAG